MTVALAKPDVSEVSTHIDDSAPFPNNTRGEALQSDSQVHVGVAWEEPDEDENIDAICKKVLK